MCLGVGVEPRDVLLQAPEHQVGPVLHPGLRRRRLSPGFPVVRTKHEVPQGHDVLPRLALVVVGDGLVQAVDGRLRHAVGEAEHLVPGPGPVQAADFAADLGHPAGLELPEQGGGRVQRLRLGVVDVLVPERDHEHAVDLPAPVGGRPVPEAVPQPGRAGLHARFERRIRPRMRQAELADALRRERDVDLEHRRQVGGVERLAGALGVRRGLVLPCQFRRGDIGHQLLQVRLELGRVLDGEEHEDLRRLLQPDQHVALDVGLVDGGVIQEDLLRHFTGPSAICPVAE